MLLSLLGGIVEDFRSFKAWMEDTTGRLNRIERQIIVRGEKMASDFTALQAGVTEETTVVASAVTLLENMAATIESLKTDPVALQGFADQIRANNQTLANAVAANTVAAVAV